MALGFDCGVIDGIKHLEVTKSYLYTQLQRPITGNNNMINKETETAKKYKKLAI